MPLELCHAATTDGLWLSGLLMQPDAGTQSTLPVDGFLIVHGTASNFYARGVLEVFAGQAVAAGVPTLRVNTRGHDPVANIRSREGAVEGGAAYECIADCCLDLTAWIDLMAARGCSQIALVGHSMGAVKAIYSQAQAAHPAVSHIIAISPPRFCHEQLLSGPGGDEFHDDFRRATELVEAGREEELLFVRRPLPLMLTAGGFLAKYGPHDDYDIMRHLPKLTVPTLIVLGTGSVGTSSAFAGLLPGIEQLASGQMGLSLEMVEGANTGYTNSLQVPFERAESWLRRG